MIIQKKRINNVQKYLDGLNCQMVYEFCIQVPNNVKNYEKLRNVNHEDIIDHTIIPTPIGPITRFNANGKEIPQKNLPKEERWFQRDYHVVDWHGNDHYGSCSVSRMCYPKTWVLPPEEEILFTTDYIKSMPLKINELNRIKHVVNMFLELFGYCEIVDSNSIPIPSRIIRRIPWKILPPGEYPWEKIEAELHNNRTFNSKKHSIERGVEILRSYHPEFCAIGIDNFNGYIVFGYPNKDLYVLESMELNNATYIFKSDWQELSKISKKQIIDGNLHYKRIIHSPQWEEQIKNLFL